MVKFVKTLAEFNNILSQAGNKLVVVDFTATWCGPCQMIGPVFEKMAEDPTNKDVIFLKVDVDEASDVAGNCGIRAMPTFQFYKNGKMKNANETTKSKEETLHHFTMRSCP